MCQPLCVYVDRYPMLLARRRLRMETLAMILSWFARALTKLVLCERKQKKLFMLR